MKNISLIINIILILNINVYSIDFQNKFETSKYKTIKTYFVNYKNGVQVSTTTKYNNTGKIIYYKHEYRLNNSIYISETSFHHNHDRIIEERYENGSKIEENEIKLDDDGKFLEIKTLFHKEKSKYKDVLFSYENGILESIYYSSQVDKSQYSKEDYYYENNKLTKFAHCGNDYKCFVKEYKYNKNDQVVKEIWYHEGNIIRSFDYTYNSLLQCNSKKYIIYTEDKRIEGHFDYYYDDNGEMIKELLFIENELESEKKYQYE